MVKTTKGAINGTKKNKGGRPAGRKGKPFNLYLNSEVMADATTLVAVRDNATGPSNLIEKLLAAEVCAVVQGRRRDQFSVAARAAILRAREARAALQQKEAA